MPKNSDEFSDFQMSRLLKRNAVQTCLEKTGKEMGGRALSLQELEYILNGGEISSLGADVPSKRIAQDNVTRYMLIQRNQSGNPEEVISETKNEKFDIMKHLEDVDWFSESDPEILDEKLAKEQDNVNKLNSEKVVIKKEPEERSSISEPSLLISKRPKVQMTKEIVDILTILEEEDVESDVKVKLLDIKNRFDFSEDSIKKELEDKEVEKSSKNETIGFKEIFEEVNRTDTEKIVEKKILTTSANEIVSETEMEYKSTEQDIKIKENEKNDNSFVSIDKIKVEYKDKASASSSSSDSESDFIPITMTDIETETRGDENEKALASLQEVSRKENDGSSQTLFAEDIPPKITESDTSFRSAILLNEAGSCPKPKKEDNQHSEAFSIIISPNKISESDNIFDDVFPADKPKTSDSEQDVEDDTVQNLSEVKESIERYKLEFQKEVPAGDLNEFKLSLEKQQREMLSEKGKQERLALNPTDQMYLDAQVRNDFHCVCLRHRQINKYIK